MKILCLLIAFSFSVFAGNGTMRRNNGLLQFVAAAEGPREYSVYLLISKRCERYLKGSAQDSCKQTVQRELELLDFDILMNQNSHTPILQNALDPSSYVFVAFKKNLINLLSDSRTEAYLEELGDSLNRFLSGENRSLLNIWDLTVSFYQSEYEASKVLSAFFQDTSHKKLHLAYLDRAPIERGANFKKNRETLGQIINNVNLILDYNEDDFRTLFYPKQIKEQLNRTIYHFYVPMYLSRALEKEGRTKRDSLTAPLMLTLTYEFITSASDYRYVYSDPQSIDGNSANGLWKIRDITGGYWGALFGVNAIHWANDFAAIKNGFTKSSVDGVRALLKLQ